MNRLLRGIREFIAPSSVNNVSVPPFEAGLRPNSDLDTAAPLTAGDVHDIDDVTAIGDMLIYSNGSTVVLGLEQPIIAELGGRVTALTSDGSAILAAVETQGLVRLSVTGAVSAISDNPDVRSGVTALAASGGRVIAAIGSATHRAGEWPESLLDGATDGRLLAVHDGGRIEVIADQLAWPSGVLAEEDGTLVVTESHRHRVIRISGQQHETLLSALPAHPGRIVASTDGWWIAFPYPRNRAAEMFMTEPDVIAAMRAEVPREGWLVPTLRAENIYRDPLQIGQQRVMGVVKPWAPPRSYGLVAHVNRKGRVTHSHHSRPDGFRHGITGLVLVGNRLIVASAGARGLLEVSHD